MAESGSHRRIGGGLQTKALAGVIALLLAAAVVALVFVTNGGGNDNRADGAGSPSDVGRTSSAAPASSSVPASPSRSVDASSTSKAAPSASISASESAAPRAKAPTAKAPSAKTSAGKPSTTHSSQNRSITYTVKKGDNLTVIAQWFHQHGYGNLYEKNKSVIGNDPDLIFPGEKITVSGAGMTTSG